MGISEKMEKKWKTETNLGIRKEKWEEISKSRKSDLYGQEMS